MSDTKEIETFNKFMVGSANEGRVVVVRPPMGPISKDDALNLAAYLVSMAMVTGEQFLAVLDAVQNS